jgi:uncharacterized protein DUF6456
LGIAAGELKREGARLFRRLTEPGYFVRSLEEEAPWAGLFGPRNKWRRPVLKIDLKYVEALHRADLLRKEKVSKLTSKAADLDDCYVISAAGEAWWRRHTATSDPFSKQHQLYDPQTTVSHRASNQQANVGESPLGWLSRRKSSDGTPFLDHFEVEAGERLRRDYTMAGLSPNVTADWMGMLAHVDKGQAAPGSQADLPVLMLDARRRVEKALNFVGPGLSDIVLETCCHLVGLEEAERLLSWPQRSAKIVLKIGLGRLAHFYGLGLPGSPKQGAHVWRAPPQASGQVS